MELKELDKFIIWLSYNTGRNTDLLRDATSIAMEYERATKGRNKHCECKGRGEAVNYYWEEWHCTYCMKPKK